mmetsp:Transcript_3988/g.25113  ORF Transcript_3988/g.25113 Transcript_3988/m.25113 type:complete len:307 (-) Transcript_3988:787-1707(-)
MAAWEWWWNRSPTTSTALLRPCDRRCARQVAKWPNLAASSSCSPSKDKCACSCDKKTRKTSSCALQPMQVPTTWCRTSWTKPAMEKDSQETRSSPPIASSRPPMLGSPSNPPSRMQACMWTVPAPDCVWNQAHVWNAARRTKRPTTQWSNACWNSTTSTPSPPTWHDDHVQQHADTRTCQAGSFLDLEQEVDSKQTRPHVPPRRCSMVCKARYRRATLLDPRPNTDPHAQSPTRTNQSSLRHATKHACASGGRSSRTVERNRPKGVLKVRSGARARKVRRSICSRSGKAGTHRPFSSRTACRAASQ